MSSYSGDFAKYYDLLYAKKDYSVESEFIRRHGRAGTLLDVGCGTLRHSIELAKSFEEIVGLDPEESMLNVGREKLRQLKITNVKVVVGTLETLRVNSAFDTVISMFNVVNHLQSLKALRSFVQAVASALKPKGIFIFDCWNGLACTIEKPHEKSERSATEGDLTLHSLTWAKTDLMESMCRMETTVTVSSGSREIAQFSYTLLQKLWTPALLKDLLEESGLRVVKLCPFGREEDMATERDYRLMYVCERS